MRNLLVVSVRSFILPSGKRGNLAAPKFKTVYLTRETAIYSAGVPPFLTLANLAVGKPVFVIGTDQGSGQPSTAREIDLLGHILGK